MKNLFAAILLFLVCLSCNSSKTPNGDGSVNFVDVNGNKVMVTSLNAITTRETVLLSDLIEDCELIRFENKDEALFKAWWIYLTVTDNYIGVRQSEEVYKLFDRSGKYLCNIGGIGNGPGEYSMSIYDEIIDEDNKKIYFTPFVGDKIMVYGLNGEHIKNITMPYRLNKAKIALSAKDVLTAIHMPFKDDKAFAVQFDMEGNILYEMKPTEKMWIQNFDGELFSFRNTPDLDIMHTSIDTLFHYDLQKNNLIPAFTTNNKQHFFEEGWIGIYRELPDRFIISYHNYKTGENHMISSHKKQLRTSYIKMTNDFWGGLEVSPTNFNKGYFIDNVEPGDLMERIEKRLAESNCTAADKKKLKELMDSLDENSNNLLFIGKLKQ